MLGMRTGTVGVFLVLADAGAIIVCFLAAFHLKKHGLLADPTLELRPYLALLAVEAPFVLAVLALRGLYAPRTLLARLAVQARAIVGASVLAFVVFLIVSFYARLFSYSRAIFTLFFLFLPAGLLIPRLAMLAATRLLGRAPGGVQRLLVFGAAAATRELAERFESSPYCRFELSTAGERPQPDDLRRIEQGRVDGVIVDLPFDQAAAIADVVSRAEHEGVAVYMTPRTLPVSMLRLSWETVGELPLIALSPPGLPPAGQTAKRALDLSLSLAGLLLLWPLLLLIAAAIRLTSRGPALLPQRRVGLDGREFTMLKFRTMRADAEADTGPVWSRPDDERCTPLGRRLRRLHLDELPQLFNVLSGSMSLVGPRPERPEFVRRFKQEVERYPHKHWVRPGITGWAQVNGWTGATRLDERIRHDLYYIEHWSFGFDLKILFLTLLPFRRLRPSAWQPRPGEVSAERPGGATGGAAPTRPAGTA